MAEQPEALRLADALEEKEYPPRRAAATELRRLYQLAQEQHTEIYGLRLKVCNLLEALELALRSHGLMLLSDPPQDAWKTYGVEAKARAAIAAVKEKNHG